MTGDTVNFHKPRSESRVLEGTRLIELIVNGQVIAKNERADARAAYDRAVALYQKIAVESPDGS